MNRTCEQCNEEFQLLPDHPGRSVICRNCITDPERVLRLNREFKLGGEVCKQVGLTIETEPFYEPEARKTPTKGKGKKR